MLTVSLVALAPIFLTTSLVPGGLCRGYGLRASPACRWWFLTDVPCFSAQEFDKLSDFFKAHYRLELAEKDLCVKGWNWGTVRFGGESW